MFLNSELGGIFEKIVVTCLQGIEEDFDPGYHNDDLVDEDVAAFYQMGEGKFGTDEAGLFKLLCTRPSEHLKKVNLAYADKHDVTLFKVMDDATVFPYNEENTKQFSPNDETIQEKSKVLDWFYGKIVKWFTVLLTIIPHLV